MHEVTTIREWLSEQESIGHPTFSLEDVRVAFPALGSQVIQNNLRRLKLERRIVSVYKRFFVIVPVKYKVRGVVPPTFYVADLMRYLNRPYYFGLLSAAKIWGASHQVAAVDFVATHYPVLNAKQSLNSEIKWCYRYSMPKEFLVERKDENGRVLYSSPELTAVEIVQYEQHCGGLSNVATVLSELVESVDFAKLPREFFAYCKGVSIQRLGYILEDVLEEKKLAEALHDQWGKNFLPVRAKLSPRADNPAWTRNRRWHLDINEKVEVDEI